ncbi:division abnormally delayed protein [Galleria mellonella]|uniref:Division abnormally delayed protein n=1 Tax=Galleria mellonella TaxID=7137 RepID=A0A6J1X3D2_GALME|nr:division abnormally delayed protein [Galleria mellonella]
MRCFIVMMLMVACAGAAAAAVAASCASSEGFFARYNASADVSDHPGAICGGQCCGRGREEHLRAALRRAAVEQAALKTRPITDLLLSTRRTLQEHLLALSHQSQNKTAGLLTQLYRAHAARAHAPLAVLYDDIRTVLRTPEHNFSRDHGMDLADSARKFFIELFPIAYQSVLKLESKQFTSSYEDCLKSAYNAVVPFGDVPKKMGTSLSRSLKAARALLEVLAAGAGVLAASEHVLSTASDECTNQLLIVGGCARCKGLDVRPCRNFCVNVARGCIGSLLAELDAPWAGYVEGMERLDQADADVELREIEGKISEAVMYALENKGTLESKVHKECGVTMTMESSSLTAPVSTPGAMRRNALRAPPPDAILLEFAASLAEKKKLFTGLGDDLCDELDFAQDGDDNCWNGKSVGDYTKPLVPSASLSHQKYNPELLSIPRDTRVAALGDKLQQARQLLVRTTIGSDANAADVFMLGDEASEEGSGSYRSYDDDASYDTEGSGDEGSGMHETRNRAYEGIETPYTTAPETGAATISRPILPAVFSVAVLAGLSHCLT